MTARERPVRDMDPELLAIELPEDWGTRAARLQGLLKRLARRRANASAAFAHAFLEAPGAVEARNQAARLATAETQLAAEAAAADVAAYQLLLKAALGELWKDNEGIGT